MRRIGSLGIRCAVLTVVLVTLSGTAFAQQPASPAPLTLEQLRWNEIQQKLNLTPDQVTALQNVINGSRVTMKADFQAMKTAHQALRTAWDSANPGTIQAAHQQVLTVKAQLATDRLNTQLQILQALGPDLYKQWRALHHHGRWGHQGWGHGPGM